MSDLGAEASESGSTVGYKFRSWLEIRGWHFDKNARQIHAPLARPIGGTANTLRSLRIVVTRGF